MPVFIYMCQSNAAEASRKGHWQRRRATFPIIQPYTISLGNLMRHDASHAPDDDVYVVETIGL